MASNSALAVSYRRLECACGVLLYPFARGALTAFHQSASAFQTVLARSRSAASPPLNFSTISSHTGFFPTGAARIAVHTRPMKVGCGRCLFEEVVALAGASPLMLWLQTRLS